ncbi:MAG: class II fructose-bisphosphate aldolase [Candidatus Paceibacterota bacterium]|jgi:fructose-bisphosphate aldolase class II
MKIKTLKEYILDAQERKVAIGHFNVSNIEMVWGIFRAAQKLNVPVIIGVSEGERDFFGVQQISAVVKSIREQYNLPIFLNADHTYSVERVKEAIDARYDAVIFDATEVSFEENVRLTKECVEYIRAKNPGLIIESELGFIGKSSKILDAIPEGVKISEEFLTKAEDAKRFVEETGIDMIAPAVGNIHGMLKGGKDPALNIKRIGEISVMTKVPLVLHGASGNSAEDIRAAIQAGVAVVHINTEIRLAYRDALKLSLQANPEEIAPYKILKSAVLAVEKVVEEKLKIFNNL